MESLSGKGLSESDLLNEMKNASPLTPGNEGADIARNNRLPELRSSQVDEVISNPPSWLVRWGITVFFFILLTLVGVVWFLEYPDLVTAKMKVVATNLPKSVNSKIDGKLVKLFVHDGTNVNKGQILAYLESTANHEEVLKLEEMVEELLTFSSKNNLERIYQTKTPFFFQLGELQKSYQTYQEAFVKTESYLANGTYLKKKTILWKDLAVLQNLQSNLQNQILIQEKDLQLAQDEFQSQERLKDKGFAAKVDVRNAESKLLGKKQIYEQSKSGLDNNLMSQNQKQQEILELDKNIVEQKNNLLQSINTLKSDIEAWKQKYLAISPTNGRVNFLTNLQENETIKTGQELLYILPEGSGYHGEMWLGQYNFGKVRKGQEVIVKFQSYPFQEFGTVKGIINNISTIPKDTAYLVRINFPNGLVTSSNKKLEFKNGMVASGEIITENMRLIEKMFYTIRKNLRR